MSEVDMEAKMEAGQQEKQEEKKVRNAYPDRLTVSPVNLEKIGGLLDQLRAAVPACDATRGDILNWLIERAEGELSASDIKDLSDRFYDEERFLKLALDEIRAAKARGERLSLAEIMERQAQGASPHSAKSPRKRRLTAKAAADGVSADSNDQAAAIPPGGDYPS